MAAIRGISAATAVGSIAVISIPDFCLLIWTGRATLAQAGTAEATCPLKRETGAG